MLCRSRCMIHEIMKGNPTYFILALRKNSKLYNYNIPTTVIAPSLNNRSLSFSETATGVFLLDSLKIVKFVTTQIKTWNYNLKSAQCPEKSTYPVFNNCLSALYVEQIQPCLNHGTIVNMTIFFSLLRSWWLF